MKELLMNSGVVAAIVVVIVGILKSPMAKFKEKRWYRPLLTILTLAIATGLCVLDQLYIFKENLLSWSFLMLVAFTFSEIYLSYHVAYEGVIKKPLHNLFNKINEAQNDPTSKTAKAIKKFKKAVSKATGIDTDTLIEIVKESVTPADSVEEVQPSNNANPEKEEPKSDTTVSDDTDDL